jgi:hypothetical protein
LTDWIQPRTRLDYLALPGVVDVRDGERTGVATLIVRYGCSGLARILSNAGVTPIGLELREEVLPPLPGEAAPSPSVADLRDCIGRPATVTVAPGARTGVLRVVKGSGEPVEVTVALDMPRAERPQDAPTSEEPS